MAQARRRIIGSLVNFVAATLVASAPCEAGGPLVVNGTGESLTWETPIPFHPDQGPLGIIDNAGAVSLVADSFDVWRSVPTAALSFANAGALAVNVTAANALEFLATCEGLSPIIFDEDGSLTDFLFGEGAGDFILGFAGPECGLYIPPAITEGIAVLNGRFVDGVEPVEIPLNDFGAVFVHELGHYVGLGHTQLNLLEAFDGDPSNDFAVPTLFPILVNAAEQLSLHKDDEVSVSTLYPAPAFPTTLGSITGTILRIDGTTPFQGANVIARNVADPLQDAVSYVSGARFFPFAEGGPPPPPLEGRYEHYGLTPGALYTVEIEEIFSGFAFGSIVGPLDPPARLPGLPEFWNGMNEAGAFPPDDPADAAQIEVTSGEVVADIDIVMNEPPPPANDACADATIIQTLPFEDVVQTNSATTAPDEPIQSCGPPSSSNSVWYRLQAPTAGTLVVSTSGSDYDTVLSAYTGVCGGPTEIACNDDFQSLQSRITVPVQAGEELLLKITDFGSADGGGRLVLNVAPAPVPGNDECIDATVISTLPFGDVIETIGATAAPDDPVQACSGLTNSNSVWYRLQAPADATLVVSTVGSDYDTVLSAYTGECGALSEIACGDEDVGSQSRIAIEVRAGDVVLLEVSDYASPDGGTLVLNVAEAPVPGNDECVDATVISTLPFGDIIETFGATTASDDPEQSCGHPDSSNSVWYRLQAPTDATLIVSTVGSDYDTVLSAHIGECGALTEIACSNDESGSASLITLDVQASDVVLLEITNHGGRGGGVLLFNIVPRHPSPVDDPANDTFGFGPVQLDVASFSACSTETDLDIDVEFFTSISPGDSGNPDALIGFIDIDADRNASTGGLPLTDVFSPFPTGMGMDFFLSLGSYSSTTGTAQLLDPFGFPVAEVSVVFDETSFTAMVPLEALAGSAGAVDLAAVIGTFSEPTDSVPNGGSLTSAASCGGCVPGQACNDGNACTVNDQCVGDVCMGTPVVDCGQLSPVSEDLTTCSPPVTDTWTFSATAGQTVAISADTVDAGTAADLCFIGECAGVDFFSADDNVACSFPPPGFACPTTTFVATASGTCTVNVALCSSACANPATANYALTVTLNASPALLTLTVDDAGAPTTTTTTSSTSSTTTTLPGTLNATDSGWWDDTGFHDADNDNYVVGACCGFQGLRNFFVFDLSPVTGVVTAATLRLSNPSDGFASPDANETYTVFDVSTSIEALSASGSAQIGIFNDLGTGSSYGAQVVSSADDGNLVDVPLNATAVSAINSALGGEFALGGAITTLGGTGLDEVVFGFTGDSGDTKQLILTVTVCDPGEGCDDGEACTVNDECVGGVCVGTPVDCAGAGDQCNTAACDSGGAEGNCALRVPRANGTACNDGQACNVGEACQTGLCTGGAPPNCSAAGDQCNTAACDPAAAEGNCARRIPVANGTACNDNDLCTQTDTCQAGTCTGANPVVCTPSDQCHDVGTCSPATGVCPNPAKPNGTTCSDGNLCTQTDTCQAGTCTGANPVVCTAIDQCHDGGTCNPATGICSGPAKPNGTACNDGSLCTQSDTCQAGTCTGANPVVCTASDQCHLAGTCNPATGICTDPAKPNGTACNDGQACIVGEACQTGLCTGGAPPDCSAAGDQCNTAACDPAAAEGNCARRIPVANGTPCDDGEACTVDACTLGTCSGTAVTIDQIQTQVASVIGGGSVAQCEQVPRSIKKALKKVGQTLTKAAKQENLEKREKLLTKARKKLEKLPAKIRGFVDKDEISGECAEALEDSIETIENRLSCST